MNALALKIKELFQKKFQAEPTLYFSPGRINLLGEHIDYNRGFVMPCSINKGIYFAIAPSGNDTIRFYARDVDEACSVNIYEIKPEEGWYNYVFGVIDQFQKSGKMVKGFNCVFGGNLPIGAGLASSAALEGGIAFALNELFDFGMDRKELALLCQRAEKEFAGVDCGIMDQFANMMGKKDEVVFLDCERLLFKYLPLSLDEYCIILINTNVHHALASSAYNTRRSECETGLNIIRENSSIKLFREIKNPKMLERFEEKMGKYVFKRCTFVVEEIERAKLGAKLLKRKKLKEFGQLMFQSHAGLSDLYKVSCAELDFLVKKAKTNEDVIGARMMGGGFGGCTINLVKESGKQKFIEESLNAYKKEFQTTPESYQVVTSDGTYHVPEEE